MGELVEGALDAEVGVEGEREHDRVRRHVAAGVVADEQHGAVVGDVAQPADLAAVPDAGQQPHQRQLLADVVRDRARPGRRAGSAAGPARPLRAGPGASERAAGAAVRARRWPLRARCRRRRCDRCCCSLRCATVDCARGDWVQAFTPPRRAAARRPACVGGIGAGEEAAAAARWSLRALDLGHVAAALERHLFGAGQPLGDVAAERGRDQPVVAAPDEQRRRLAARPAGDRSRARPKGASR